MRHLFYWQKMQLKIHVGNLFWVRTGLKGEAGIDGKDGSFGPQGEKGDIGLVGYRGEKGDRGLGGPSGIPGTPGEFCHLLGIFLPLHETKTKNN